MSCSWHLQILGCEIWQISKEKTNAEQCWCECQMLSGLLAVHLGILSMDTVFKEM